MFQRICAGTVAVVLVVWIVPTEGRIAQSSGVELSRCIKLVSKSKAAAITCVLTWAAGKYAEYELLEFGKCLFEGRALSECLERNEVPRSGS